MTGQQEHILVRLLLPASVGTRLTGADQEALEAVIDERNGLLAACVAAQLRSARRRGRSRTTRMSWTCWVRPSGGRRETCGEPRVV